MKKSFGLLLALMLTLNVLACTNTIPKKELNVNRSNFAKVKVGETIVITNTEALALSVKEKTE